MCQKYQNTLVHVEQIGQSERKIRVSRIEQQAEQQPEKPLVIKKEFPAMTQLDDVDLIAVRIQHEGETQTSTSRLISIVQQSKPAALKPLIRWKEQGGVF